jgi:DHA1 family multidrug resistance protein-like MFS transporter
MNRSLLWLGAALFLWGLGESMFLLFQPVYLQELGAAPIEIGVILGAFGAAMTLTHIPAGHLSDRLGRRPMLIAAWLVGVLATILMALALNLPMFIVGLLLYGFTAFVASPLDSYTTAARGKWSVARAITFVSMTFNGGAVIGPLIGGRVADVYGFRPVYFIAAGLFVLSTLVVTFVAAQPRDQHDPDNPPGALLHNRRYMVFLAVFFFVAFAAYVPQPLSSNYLRNQQGLSLSTIGQLISIAYLGTTILALVLGQLEARTGFLLGQVAVAAFAVFLWKGLGLGWFAVGYFLLGGYRPLRGLGVAQVRSFVHKSQMGLAYGMAETLGSASTLLAPPLAGLLYSRDPVLMYPTGAVLIALGFLITLAVVPRSGVLPPEHVELMIDP